MDRNNAYTGGHAFRMAVGITILVVILFGNSISAVAAPQITSISPTQIAGSTFDLTINGNNFDTGAIDQIYWKATGTFIGNGVIISRTSTKIVTRQAMTGIAIGVYTVKVKNSDGTLSNSADLTIIPPVPQITSITPTQIVGSTFDLTINGNNFDTGAIDQIYWKATGTFIGNGVIISRTSTKIVTRQAMTGIAAGIYSVKVKNSDGQLSNDVDLTITAPVPQITSISPSQVVGSTFDLTINGNNFDTGAIDQIYWKATGAFNGNGIIISRTSTKIVTRQAMTGMATGLYTVKVKNSDGQLSNGVDLTLIPPAPQITSISPSQIVGSTFDLTINGNNFDTGAIDQIYWKATGTFIGNGVIISRTSTKIVTRQAMTGIAAGIYSVKVKNSDGQLSNNVDLTITAPVPQITSISPSQVVGSTFDLTINGNNFDTGAIDQIYWKATGAFNGNGIIISRTSTKIVTRQAMTGMATGLYTVKVKNSDGQLSNGVDLTLMPALDILNGALYPYPNVFAPGDTITFVYSINNPTTSNINNVRLGARIRTNNPQGTWIDDWDNDLVEIITPGTNNYERTFKVNPSTSPGFYDAEWVILDNSTEQWYDFLDMSPIFQVQSTPSTRSYTFQTTNNAMSITVDGTSYTSPQTFNWADGATHSISVPSSQAIVSGQSQYVFTAWSGMSTSTSTSISINTGASTAGNYNANYKTQYYLTVNTDPSSLSSISGSGWYDSGTTATTGTAPGTVGTSTFSTWKKDGVAVSGNPISVIMDSPYTATAAYQTTSPLIEPRLEATMIKSDYGKGQQIKILAKVFDQDGNTIITDRFSVKVDGMPQNIQYSYSKDLITLKAPDSLGPHTIEIKVSPGMGEATVIKNIVVNDYATYKVLMILACLDNVCANGQPIDDWYDENNGNPQWYRNVANEVETYYSRISYNQIKLDITTTNEWIIFENSPDFSDVTHSDRGQTWYNRAIIEAKNINNVYDSTKYDIVIAVDPNDRLWDSYEGMVSPNNKEVMVFTPHSWALSNPYYNMVKLTAHEITHAIDYLDDGIQNIRKLYGDNIISEGYSIMGSRYQPYLIYFSYLAPFDPKNAEKMKISDYTHISVPIDISLLPIEGGKDRPIHNKMDVMEYNNNILISSVEYNYWVEFRDGSWYEERKGKKVLVWKSEDPINSQDPPYRDHANLVGQMTDSLFGNTFYDPDAHYSITVTGISDTKADVKITFSTDSFSLAREITDDNYSIDMYLLAHFAENIPYNISVIDIDSQKEVFNSTLMTNNNGGFDLPINFVDNIQGNVEIHPYLIRLYTVNGWVPLLITYPSKIDGVSNETLTFVVADSVETNTAGDLIRLTSAAGSMKLSLETAASIDTSSYKYVLYFDSDNLSSTGYTVNNIGADYKIEYNNSGARFYKYNTSSWISNDTQYLNATHNGTNIEILTSNEIMNKSKEIKIVAQTFDSTNNLYDTIPDPNSRQPYLQFIDAHPMNLEFADFEYNPGDTVKINGYGFSPYQSVPIILSNQTDTLWSSDVQADSDGRINNTPTWTIPSDYENAVNLYWNGALMDSFSAIRKININYGASAEIIVPKIVGIEYQFNVTVNLTNSGETLTNTTMKLNSSGKIQDTEVIPLGTLESGTKYSHIFTPQAKDQGFEMINVEISSDQGTFIAGSKGINIANFSMNIDAPANVSKGEYLNFNNSAINNQNDVIYTDLKMETAINNTDINFTKPILSFSPDEIINSSYSINTNDIMPGKYQILTTIISNGTILASNEQEVTIEISDTIPVINWAVKANMPTPRSSLFRGRMTIGDRIFVFGGYNGTVLDKVEVYNVSEDNWKTVASLPSPRLGGGVQTAFGKIYIFGGSDQLDVGASNYVWAYDPITDSYMYMAMMPSGRRSFASALINGDIYILGGVDSSNTVSSLLYKYNIASNSWALRANHPSPRRNITAESVNGKIYTFGGDSNSNLVHEYNPISNSWAQKRSMPVAIESPNSIVVNGQIYVVGGDNSHTILMYDPVNNTWLGPLYYEMPTPRALAATAEVKNRIYVIGGCCPSLYSNVNEEAIFVDKEPPSNVINLHNSSYDQTYINWTWTDPSDLDFDKVMIYIDGIFQTNVTNGMQYYNATGLTANTEYNISTQTVDIIGNINQTWVNRTARTAPLISGPRTIIVNASGGADYTSIQDAVNAANNGDTILVQSGTYYENVNITKQLILRGIDNGGGKPVVNSGGSSSAITLSADGVTLDAFNATESRSYPNAGIMVTSSNNILSGNNASNNNNGIYLRFSNNNTLTNNTAISNGFFGIFLESSSNNTLTNNIASSNADPGIYLNLASNNNILTNNTANLNNVGIYLYSTGNNTLTNNTVSSNNQSGIYLLSASNNTLTNNTAISNNQSGIFLQSSNNNTLTNNIASSNADLGIYLNSGSNNNILTNNTANLNNIGIYLYSTGNNILTNNIASLNSNWGIYLLSTSNDNTLTDNTANLNNIGIYLDSASNNNTLTNNTASSNSHSGIYLLSAGNNLTNNTLSSNSIFGIYLPSNDNTLTSNIIRLNGGYGIYIGLAINNNIYNNYFNNTKNYFFADVINSNRWNTTKILGKNIIGNSYVGGNFWAYPNGTGFSQTCTDSDKNGICDSAYNLDKDNIDYLPLATTTILPAIRYINGTIMDSLTKEILEGVTVSTTGASNMSNVTGFYSLEVANGTYPLTATYDVRYYMNNSVTVSTELWAAVVQDIEFVKKPTGNISGSVTNI